MPPTPAEQTQILREQGSNIQQHQQQENSIIRERQLQDQAPSSIDIEQSWATPQVADDAVCFDIHTIELRGAKHLTAAEKETLKLLYLGQCIGMGSINDLVRDITNHYVDKGYVTSRAYVPEQDVSNGELVIEIVEGKIESIKLNENSRRDRMQTFNAFPLALDTTLNLRDIEQGLDQMNRLLSNQATVKLEPGKDPGNTVVKVENNPARTFRISLGLDNAGQHSTGTVQRKIGVEKDNLIGVNDQWTINYLDDNLDTANKGHRSLSGYFSVPFGYWTFSYNGSYFEYESIISGLNTNFETSGDSLTNTFTLNRVIHRDTDSKSSIDTRLIVKETNNFLEGNRLDVGSRQLSIAHLGLNYSRKILGGVVNLGLAYEKGIKIFHALEDPDVLASGEASAQFDKYITNLNFSRPFNLGVINLGYSLALTGQFTDDDLFNSEQLSLGGQYSIRGFKEEIALGDSGAYLRNELTAYLPTIQQKLLAPIFNGLQLFAGYDIGSLKTEDTDPLERGTLSGVALGLRKPGGHFTWELVVGKSLTAPNYITEAPYEGYLSVGLNF